MKEHQIIKVLQAFLSTKSLYYFHFRSRNFQINFTFPLFPTLSSPYFFECSPHCCSSLVLWLQLLLVKINCYILTWRRVTESAKTSYLQAKRKLTLPQSERRAGGGAADWLGSKRASFNSEL